MHLVHFITCFISMHFVATSVASLSQHPITLVVAFDGFRYNYLDKDNTPFLWRFGNQGVRVPAMRPQFPASTFPNFATINTGLYPDNHGVIDNVVYDPVAKKVLGGYTDDEGFWTQNDALPIWILNEAAGQGRFSGTIGNWPGSAVGYGANHSLFSHYGIYKNKSWESYVSSALSWITNPEKPANLVFLYYEDPDNAGHKFGPDSFETKARISFVDRKFGYLLEAIRKAGLSMKINIIVVSDHGMEIVHNGNGINLYDSGVNGDLLKFLENQNVVNLRVKRVKDVPLIYHRLKSFGKNRNFSVFKKSQLPVRFPGFGRNERVADLVLLPDPGYYFAHDKGGNGGVQEGVRGGHGYDPEVCENMKTVFLAGGPSFKRNYSRGKEMDILDVFPLLCELVGISVPKRDGSLDRVKDMLRKKIFVIG